MLISAACGADDTGPDPASDTTATATPVSSVPDRTLPPDRRPAPVSSTSAPPVVIGEVPVGLLDEIVADAAERSAVAIVDVEVLRAEAVTWPDGSLGCPKPGVVYTQALVPGYWVVLQADDQQLDYRVGGQGSFLLCEDSTTAAPPGAGSDGTG